MLHDITIHISARASVCVYGLFQKQEKDQKKCPTLLRVKIKVGFVKHAKQTQRETEDRSADEEAALKHSRFFYFSPNVLLNIMKDFFFFVCACMCACYELKKYLKMKKTGSAKLETHLSNCRNTQSPTPGPELITDR